MRNFLESLKGSAITGLTAGGMALASVEIEKQVDFVKQNPWLLPAASLVGGTYLKAKMPHVGNGLVGYGGFYLTLFLYSKFVTKTAQTFTIGQATGYGDMAAGAGAPGLSYEEQMAGALLGAGDMGDAGESTYGYGDAGALMGAGGDNAEALSDAFGLEA